MPTPVCEGSIHELRTPTIHEKAGREGDKEDKGEIINDS